MPIATNGFIHFARSVALPKCCNSIAYFLFALLFEKLAHANFLVLSFLREKHVYKFFFARFIGFSVFDPYRFIT